MQINKEYIERLLAMSQEEQVAETALLTPTQRSALAGALAEEAGYTDQDVADFSWFRAGHAELDELIDQEEPHELCGMTETAMTLCTKYVAGSLVDSDAIPDQPIGGEELAKHTAIFIMFGFALGLLLADDDEEEEEED